MEHPDPRQLSTPELIELAAQLARADDSGDDEARRDAVGELWHRPVPEVFAQAVNWCQSADARERSLGAQVLSQLGPPSFPFRASSTTALGALLHDNDERVVVAALFACGHLAIGPLPTLLAFADHVSADLRYAAVLALARRTEPDTLPVLCRLTEDVDDDVRNWATFTLGTMQEEIDTPALREALMARLTETDDEIRGEALVGLARRRDPRVVAAIAAELRRERVTVLAVEAAELLPHESFIAPLEALWRDVPDADILRALESCRASTL